MSSDSKALLRRVTGLELAVKRLQMAIGGIVGATESARLAAISCERCKRDMMDATTCDFDDCPCGLDSEYT